MPNRNTRDELIKTALNMVTLPNLEVHDMPDGVVQQDAFMIDWLQEIIDYWHHMVPFSATVTHQTFNCIAHFDTLILPDDFIVDVRHGFMVQTKVNDPRSFRRIIRYDLPRFIRYWEFTQGAKDIPHPLAYCIVGDDGDPVLQRQTMMIAPTPTIDTQGMLWYYRLPARLAANQRPKMNHSDYICSEYLRHRALEWAGINQPGSAFLFAQKVVGAMRSAGLLNEPEDSAIPFDPLVNVGKTMSHLQPYSWMGPI